MTVPIENNGYVEYLRYARDVLEGLPDAVVSQEDKRLVREFAGLETTRIRPGLRSLERVVESIHGSVVSSPKRTEATVRNLAATLSALQCVWLARNHAKHYANILLLDAIRDNAGNTDLVVRVMRIVEYLGGGNPDDAARDLDELFGFLSKEAVSGPITNGTSDRLKTAALYVDMLAG